MNVSYHDETFRLFSYFSLKNFSAICFLVSVPIFPSDVILKQGFHQTITSQWDRASLFETQPRDMINMVN